MKLDRIYPPFPDIDPTDDGTEEISQDIRLNDRSDVTVNKMIISVQVVSEEPAGSRSEER